MMRLIRQNVQNFEYFFIKTKKVDNAFMHLKFNMEFFTFEKYLFLYFTFVIKNHFFKGQLLHGFFILFLYFFIQDTAEKVILKLFNSDFI